MPDKTELNPAQANIKKTRSFSMVWFIPIVALALGAWLVYKNKQDKGPLITISFESATGLEAGKTKIKHKDVDLGFVEGIELSDDFSHVVVSARMDKETVPYLNESTKFWVVKPRVELGGVTGLSTLLSGAYIGIDSNSGGKPVTSFTGLENPPPRSNEISGVNLVLYTEDTGSLVSGSPVYYKQFNVGQVDSVELTDDFSSVKIEVFVNAPYDKLINQNTNFWNVSGISAELSANGISVQVQSMESLISGGIAFDSPIQTGDAPFDPGDVAFRLYDNRDAIGQKTYTIKEFYILNFNQSVRGLKVGAPVDYRGIEIGEVVSIDVHYEQTTGDIYVPVLIGIEPERLNMIINDQDKNTEQQLKRLQARIDDGLRAKLQTGNLLTGQLFVSVDMFPEAEPASVQLFNGYPEIPTLSTDLDQITQNFSEVLEKVNKLEVEKVIDNVNLAVTELRNLLGNTDSKMVTVLNSLDRTLAESRKLMQGLDEDSITRYELNTLLREIQEAARSVRTLVETIEENPNSVIFGKLRKSEK